MRFADLLVERYLNLRNDELKAQYAPIALSLVNVAYAPIGGHVNIQSEDDLYEFPFWKIVKRHGKPIAIALYKDRIGRKLVAIGHDGSRAAKDELKAIFAADIKHKRMWAEVSGGFANYCIKLGLPPVPNEFAEELLNKDILATRGKFKYDRILGGLVHTKMIVGFPNGKQYPISSWEIDDTLFSE